MASSDDSAKLPGTRVDFELPGGIRIAADRWGAAGAPAVLFLHGGGQTRHAWGGTARAVAQAGYQALSMDHRGHGESSFAPDGDYQSEAFVADLLAVLAQLSAQGVARPILVGASLGGITALMAEGVAPAPISSGIVLVDITPRVEPAGIMRIIDFMAARPDGFASLEEAADTIAAYVPHRPRPKDLAGLEKNLRRGDDGRYRWHWDPKLLEVWQPRRYDPAEGERIARERLDAARRLRVPLMLVRGRMSDVVSEANARELLDAVPGAEYVDLADAAHMVAGDKNDAFTAAVLGFVSRHAQR